MPIEFNDNDPDFRFIQLSGRLDIPGTAEVETKFAALTATGTGKSIVDLRAVSFLASIGLRAIISCAKAQQQRGGKMVLLVGENEAVIKTLEMTGIDALLPIRRDLEEARAALQEG